MPYRIERTKGAPADAGAPSHSGPGLRIEAWPHRSLGPTGHAAALSVMAAGMLIPLIVSLGHPAFWVFLVFLGVTFAALARALAGHARQAGLREVLTLTGDRIEITRTEADGSLRHWTGNPYWARAELVAGGPVEDYLVISGGGRRIEFGAFLSPEERRALHGRLAPLLGLAA